MFQSERMRLCTLKIKNANEPVLDKQGHDELGTRFQARVTGNVARIFGDVIDPQGSTLARGGARKAFVKREMKSRSYRVLAAHGEHTLQQLRLFIPEHHAENVIIHDFFHAFGDTL